MITGVPGQTQGAQAPFHGAIGNSRRDIRGHLGILCTCLTERYRLLFVSAALFVNSRYGLSDTSKTNLRTHVSWKWPVLVHLCIVMTQSRVQGLPRICRVTTSMHTYIFNLGREGTRTDETGLARISQISSSVRHPRFDHCASDAYLYAHYGTGWSLGGYPR